MSSSPSPSSSSGTLSPSRPSDSSSKGGRSLPGLEVRSPRLEPRLGLVAMLKDSDESWGQEVKKIWFRQNNKTDGLHHSSWAAPRCNMFKIRILLKIHPCASNWPSSLLSRGWVFNPFMAFHLFCDAWGEEWITTVTCSVFFTGSLIKSVIFRPMKSQRIWRHKTAFKIWLYREISLLSEITPCFSTIQYWNWFSSSPLTGYGGEIGTFLASLRTN